MCERESRVITAGSSTFHIKSVFGFNPRNFRNNLSEHRSGETMNTDVAIPFLDLVTPHVELEEELTALFRSVLHSAGFIGGPMVENFETAFAEFCDTRHAIAVNSGTDALRFAIIASGVQAGDVVLTVPNTFIATTEAISQARAIPEFVDVDEHTYNMSVVMLQAICKRNAFAINRDGLSAFAAAVRLRRLSLCIFTDRWRIWIRFSNLRSSMA